MVMSTVNTIKYSFKHEFSLQGIDLILTNSWSKIFAVWLPQYIICISENTLQAMLPPEVSWSIIICVMSSQYLVPYWVGWEVATVECQQLEHK